MKCSDDQRHKTGNYTNLLDKLIIRTLLWTFDWNLFWRRFSFFTSNKSFYHSACVVIMEDSNQSGSRRRYMRAAVTFNPRKRISFFFLFLESSKSMIWLCICLLVIHQTKEWDQYFSNTDQTHANLQEFLIDRLINMFKNLGVLQMVT